ncbi:MAG: ImmA/IrrE family metallo-endopeptidase [Eubacteriaceae bacterium]
MFLRMLKKANYFLREYEILDFPISIELIQEIFNDLNYRIVIIKNMKQHGTIYADNILITGINSACLRENMCHECGHIVSHHYNQYCDDKIQIIKNEAQAQAFAAYLLMPVFIFEETIKYCNNDYEVSEEFGVNVEFVQYRKTLTAGLVRINYFKKTRNKFNEFGSIHSNIF